MKMFSVALAWTFSLCLVNTVQAQHIDSAAKRSGANTNLINHNPLNSGVAVTFKSAGTLTITLNGATVASGAPVLQGYTPTTASGKTISTNRGTLTQTYPNLTMNITHDCVLNGTDLTITSHITNTGTAAIGTINLTYPPFTFSATPTGTMPSWHWTYLQQQGISLMHPSWACPIGCVHAADSKYAVAAWSASEMGKPSLIQGQWIKDGVLANPLPIELHTVETIAVGASIDVSLTIRVTTDLTTLGLLSGYKAILPAMSYTPLHKPATEAISIDPSWVTPSDPFGYNGDFRRLDLATGAANYVATVTPLLKASGGSGVIFWAPGGYQASSWYPVDFDVNLARIASTWPITVAGLKANGYRVGMCARIGDALDPNGAIRRADPTNPTDVATMLTRLDYCANTGVDMWYLDSTCEDWTSTTMLAIAAKHLGSSHNFYSEYANDVSMGFAGVYCEWQGTKTYWLTESQRAELMVLYPDSDWICVDRSGTQTAASLEAKGLWPLTLD